MPDGDDTVGPRPIPPKGVHESDTFLDGLDADLAVPRILRDGRDDRLRRPRRIRACALLTPA